MQQSNGWKDAGIFVSGCDHVSISNNDIGGGGTPGNSSDVGHIGVQVAGSTNIILENNSIHNAVRGTYVAGAGGVPTTDVVVRGNTYSDNIGDNSVYGSNISGITIENNTFHSLDPANADDTHQDHIQFWIVNNAFQDTSNVTIRGNTILQSGAGDVQSIFLRAENSAFHHRNIVVENNLIYAAQQHGISLSNIIGGAISNNTLIWSDYTDGRPGSAAPVIYVGHSDGVGITNNIADAYSFWDWDGNSNITAAGNITTSRTDPNAPGYYDNIYNNALADAGGITLEDLMYRPEGLADNGDGTFVGATPRFVPEGLTAIISKTPLQGGSDGAFAFSGIHSLGEDGQPLEGATYRWTFSDGTQKEGLTVEHAFADGSVHQATLAVEDQFGHVDSFTRTIVLPNPHALSLSLAGSIDDDTALATSATWIGEPSYVETGDGLAAYFNGRPPADGGNYIRLARDPELFSAKQLTLSMAFKSESDGLARTQALFENLGRYGASVSFGTRLNISIEGKDHFFSPSTTETDGSTVSPSRSTRANSAPISMENGSEPSRPERPCWVRRRAWNRLSAGFPGARRLPRLSPGRGDLSSGADGRANRRPAQCRTLRSDRYGSDRQPRVGECRQRHPGGRRHVRLGSER